MFLRQRLKGHIRLQLDIPSINKGQWLLNIRCHNSLNSHPLNSNRSKNRENRGFQWEPESGSYFA
jgi:hypothetical protein